MLIFICFSSFLFWTSINVQCLLWSNTNTEVGNWYLPGGNICLSSFKINVFVDKLHNLELCFYLCCRDCEVWCGALWCFHTSETKTHKGCFYRSPPHRGHLLTLCVSSAAGSVSSSKGRSPDTDSLQRQNFLPFLLNVSHRHLTPFAPLLSCLSNARPLPPSGSLYYFILLQSLPASIISASALSLYLSLPLTSLQHCSAAEGDASTLLFLFLVFCLQGV